MISLAGPKCFRVVENRGNGVAQEIPGMVYTDAMAQLSIMRFWMVAFWLATVLPLAALLAWIWPALVARGRRSGRVAPLGLILLWLAGGAALLAFPHEDVFAGLDVAAYRKLAHVFADGRGFHDRDALLEEVPATIRTHFYYRSGSSRPTRDLVFQLSGRDDLDTEPFFMPTMSLAAAGMSPGLSPDLFLPLLGALGLALVLAAGFCGGGGWGLLAVAALALGTAWPAWFLRGFYAEGLGAVLVSGVVAAASARPLRGGMAALAGFSLGLAVSFHPTLVVLSGPVALGLMLEGSNRKKALAVAVGMLAGLFPFWALTRWVCAPYGDWTRWATLKEMVFSVPEHRAVALALAGMGLVFAAGLWTGFRPSVRAKVRRLDSLATPWGWLAVWGLPWLGVAICPDGIGGTLRSGSESVWSGIRWPFALLLLAGVGTILAKQRPLRERFWLAALGGAALFFIFIKGLETPVGLWSQRRFLPVVLTGIALLAAPLSVALAAAASRWPRAKWLAASGVMAAGLWNMVHWPTAYFTVNERGATAWTQEIAQRMGTNRWVVFDYYPHSVPYAAGLKHRVLGLGESSRSHWPEVMGWISSLAQTEEVWVATSWSPCALEKDFRLEPLFSTTGSFPIVKTKDFFPAVRGERIVQNTIFRLVPLRPGEAIIQTKDMDGGPMSLRGPWGETREGASWTREGSGLLGPVPPQGGRVLFEADCAWTPPSEDWTEQILRVASPWGGEALRLTVPAGSHVAKGVLARPADDPERPATGLYSFRADRPYNPAEQGLRGYPPDLGVQIRRIIIRVESSGSSVPD